MDAEGRSVKCLVSLGENFENPGWGGFSKTRTIFFGRVLMACGEKLNSLRATNGVGRSVSVGFHGVAHGRRSDSHCSGKSGLTEKHHFIEIGSQAEGGIFKKSDMSNTDRRIGVEATVLLGFRYCKGR